MSSVVITNKKTGEVVAEIRVNIHGQNYRPTPAQHHEAAWRIAVDDKLVEADADKDDYAFEVVPVSLHDAFSTRR